MRSDYIYERTKKIVSKYKTRDPVEILEAMGVIVLTSDGYEKLKGYCFLSCRIFYVVLSSSLSDMERRTVAAHELGHILLHKDQLKLAPMGDSALYNMTGQTEYEANLFAADLLIEDESVEEMSKDPDADYFSICSSLGVSPELMSFKLFSLIKRGYSYNMPMDINSCFLAKDD